MILLSILTPAVPSRLAQVEKLCAELSRQIGNQPVEHLVFLDNKKRTVGEKRDALLRMAKGRYVAFCDDDDWVAPDYISSLLAQMGGDPDVITFRQEAFINGVKGEIEFKLGNRNEDFQTFTKRNAWHVCAWRRELAMLSNFPAKNYGEDWAFASKLCGLAGLKSAHVDKVLHFYYHSEKTTEAPCPK